jgi:two-component system, OmpR family, sensor histidine kinase KdpD
MSLADAGRRVLVVEDEAALRQVLRLNLAARGYRVDTAVNGRSALDLVQHRRPDLVILDLGLPDLDGLEVIGGIRGFSAAPILVISARDTPAAETAAIAAGAGDFLLKPFGIDHFVARVAAALRPADCLAERTVCLAERTVCLAERTVCLAEPSVSLPWDPRPAPPPQDHCDIGVIIAGGGCRTAGEGGSMRRTVIGSAAALASMALVTAALLPLRSHLSIATTALILVVPVVIGVVLGGFGAGTVSVLAGFLVYDFFFIPPYETLWVGAPQNWAALGVYALVMLPVAHVVAGMNAARARAHRREREITELFELSDLLLEDKPLDTLLSVIVTTLADVFRSRKVALFLPSGNGLEVAASAGDPLTEEELRRVRPARGEVASQEAQSSARDGLLVVALAAAGRPVGLLVLSSDAAARYEREPLLLFANQIALAVERAQLREQALQSRVSEEMARLAKTLVAAVSHDLRSPLASLKASSSTLADPGLEIGPDATRRLATLIDSQADRLADLVQNLLDMSRVQAGVLQPRRTITSLAGLVHGVVNDLAERLHGHAVCQQIPDDLPPVDIDLVLIGRVLTNLLENAVRHSPRGAAITISGAPTAGVIEVSVTDRGPGVSPDRRAEIFELFPRREGDAGAGLGLTIAKTFVEAHGQRIWVEDARLGGARFCFTLPVAAQAHQVPVPEEGSVAEHSRH